MPKSKAGTISRRGADSRRFEEVKGSAQIVKDAVALLDERLAAGIQRPNNCNSGSASKGASTLPTAATRYNDFRPMPNEGIALLNDRLDEMRLQENFDLVQERVERSHDLVDVAVELVNGRVSRNTGLRRKALHPGNDPVRGQS